MLSHHTTQELKTLWASLGIGGSLGFLLALGLELSGQPMNWADRIGTSGVIAFLAILVASAIITLRRQS